MAPGLDYSPMVVPTKDIGQQAPNKRLPIVQCQVRARVPTTTGSDAWMYLYSNDEDDKEHLAIVFGDSIWSRSLNSVWEGEDETQRMVRGAYAGNLFPGRTSSGSEGCQKCDQLPVALKGAPLVRVHSECFTGETAWSTRCDCGEQFDEAGRMMVASMGAPASSGRSSPGSLTEETSVEERCAGVIVYLRQEGRGIGLKEKLKTFNVQDLGCDTLEANLYLNHPADARNFGVATAILVDLGLGSNDNPDGICLLTNNPNKLRTVGGPAGEVKIKERVPMVPLAWQTGGQTVIQSPELEGYLETKLARMGHMLESRSVAQ
ncbi:Hypothetical protein R9X50_00274400 [Acrodontium crateriforme]|uniref:GTP cyclohydrolase II n=1 Tax=Acrodontium crateriforme TaxID=150365 RepID=A0AAQ3R6X3_9PEZI|nr:Hypothetical protein R9X50_00274400 [Acrodontium crateriforme]